MATGRMLLTWEDWNTRQQGPQSLISANRGLWMLIRVILIHLHNCDSFVVSLHGLKKEPVEVSVSFVWLPIEWPLLRSVGLDSQCKTDGIASTALLL